VGQGTVAAVVYYSSLNNQHYYSYYRGRTKGQSRHSQTWWSNDEVAELIIERKDICIEFLKNLKMVRIGK